MTTSKVCRYNKIELSLGPWDLRAFLIPLYINYQATTFGHQYLFEWYFRFDDSSAQSFLLQNARLFIATSMLGLVLNQDFNQAQGRLAYQILLFF